MVKEEIIREKKKFYIKLCNYVRFVRPEITSFGIINDARHAAHVRPQRDATLSRLPIYPLPLPLSFSASRSRHALLFQNLLPPSTRPCHAWRNLRTSPKSIRDWPWSTALKLNLATATEFGSRTAVRFGTPSWWERAIKNTSFIIVLMCVSCSYGILCILRSKTFTIHLKSTIGTLGLLQSVLPSIESTYEHFFCHTRRCEQITSKYISISYVWACLRIKTPSSFNNK